MQVIFIRNKIYEIRGQRVMLDYDLAELYEVETRVINQAVKRNIERFPEDFMFRLTSEEWMRSQNVLSSGKGDKKIQTFDNQYDIKENGIQIVANAGMRSQTVTSSSSKRRKTLLPYAFTEHGVTMLASVLKSSKAVKMSIEVVRAFISLKQFAIEQRQWEDRERIGFKNRRGSK